MVDTLAEPTGKRAGLSPDPLADLTPETLVTTYARLREAAPVHWSRYFGGWVLTRHADAVTVLGDPTFLADDPIARFDRLEKRGGVSLPNLRTLLTDVPFYTNPPRHLLLRRFLSRLFQLLELTEVRGRLAERADALMSAARQAGGINLVAGFGNDLALFVMSTALSLPFEDCVAVAGNFHEVARNFELEPKPLRELRRTEAGVGVVLDYFERLVVERRGGPEEDGFSLLVRLGDRELGMNDRELAGFCTFVFMGGQETTGTGIPHAAVMLLERGDVRARLAAKPGKIAGAARELLRLAAPFQYVARIASRDGEIGGQAIAAGERVNIILGAANRDPAAFLDPDAIDIDRQGPDSLAFGHGAYRCLGMAVAHMETEVALAALLANPDLRLVPGSVVWDTRTRVPALTRAWAEFA